MTNILGQHDPSTDKGLVKRVLASMKRGVKISYKYTNGRTRTKYFKLGDDGKARQVKEQAELRALIEQEAIRKARATANKESLRKYLAEKRAGEEAVKRQIREQAKKTVLLQNVPSIIKADLLSGTRNKRKVEELKQINRELQSAKREKVTRPQITQDLRNAFISGQLKKAKWDRFAKNNNKAVVKKYSSLQQFENHVYDYLKRREAYAEKLAKERLGQGSYTPAMLTKKTLLTKGTLRRAWKGVINLGKDLGTVPRSAWFGIEKLVITGKGLAISRKDTIKELTLSSKASKQKYIKEVKNNLSSLNPRIPENWGNIAITLITARSIAKGSKAYLNAKGKFVKNINTEIRFLVKQKNFIKKAFPKTSKVLKETVRPLINEINSLTDDLRQVKDSVIKPLSKPVKAVTREINNAKDNITQLKKALSSPIVKRYINLVNKTSRTVRKLKNKISKELAEYKPTLLKTKKSIIARPTKTTKIIKLKRTVNREKRRIKENVEDILKPLKNIKNKIKKDLETIKLKKNMRKRQKVKNLYKKLNMLDNEITKFYKAFKSKFSKQPKQETIINIDRFLKRKKKTFQGLKGEALRLEKERTILRKELKTTKKGKMPKAQRTGETIINGKKYYRFFNAETGKYVNYTGFKSWFNAVKRQQKLINSGKLKVRKTYRKPTIQQVAQIKVKKPYTKPSIKWRATRRKKYPIAKLNVLPKMKKPYRKPTIKKQIPKAQPKQPLNKRITTFQDIVRKTKPIKNGFEVRTPQGQILITTQETIKKLYTKPSIKKIVKVNRPTIVEINQYYRQLLKVSKTKAIPKTSLFRSLTAKYKLLLTSGIVKPSLSAKVIPKSIILAKLKPLTKVKIKVKPLARVKAKVKAKSLARVKAKVKAKSLARVKAVARQKLILKQRLKASKRIKALPFIIPTKVKNSKSVKIKLQWIRRKPIKYRPSLIAILFNIKGKMPKTISGFNLRPILNK